MKLPDYINCKYLYSKDNKVFAELELKYLPLGIFLSSFFRIIGFRLWLYPKMIKHLLSNLAVKLK